MDRFQVNHHSAVPAQDYNSSNQGAQVPTHSNLDRWNQTPNPGNVISRSGSSNGDRQRMGNSGHGTNGWISTDNRRNTYPSGTLGGGTGYYNGRSDGSHQAVGNDGLGSSTWIDQSSGTNGGYGYGNQQSYTDHQSRYNSHHQGTRSASYSPYGSAHEDTRQQMRYPPQHPMQSSSRAAPQQQNPVVSGHRGNIPTLGGPDPYATTTTGSDPYLSNRMNSTANGSGLDRSWRGQVATGRQLDNHWQTSNFNPAVVSYPQPSYNVPFQSGRSQFHNPSIQLPSSTSTNDYIGHLSSQQPLPTGPPCHQIAPTNSHGCPGQPQGQPGQVFSQQQSTSIAQSQSFSAQHGSNPGQLHPCNTAISGYQVTSQAGAYMTSSGQINQIGQQPGSSSLSTLSTTASQVQSSDVPPSQGLNTDEVPEQRGRTYPCETCHRVFKYRTSLANHRRIHLDLRPYKCDVCGKAFRDQSTFNKHSRIHTGVKPYVCPVCNAGFSQSGNLRRHTSSKHADTE